MNQVFLVGEVAELPFYTTTEKAAADLTKFSLKTESLEKPSWKQRRDSVHQCVAWGPSALLLHQHLRLHSKLAIRGSIRYHRFTTPTGCIAQLPEIVVQEFTFLDGR